MEYQLEQNPQIYSWPRSKAKLFCILLLADLPRLLEANSVAKGRFYFQK